MLHLIGLSEMQGRYPFQLSGGQHEVSLLARDLIVPGAWSGQKALADGRGADDMFARIYRHQRTAMPPARMTH